MKALLVLLLCLPLASCTKSKAAEVIAIDDWWSYDYAKNYCSLEHMACFDGARREVASFENRFSTAFGSDPNCHDLRLTRHGNPLKPTKDEANVINGQHWSLSFSIVPDDRNSQSWSLIHSPDNKRYAEGDSSPADTAHQVCTFIKGVGGSTE